MSGRATVHLYPSDRGSSEAAKGTASGDGNAGITHRRRISADRRQGMVPKSVGLFSDHMLICQFDLGPDDFRSNRPEIIRR